jgi:tetratricopeptide (TPR) repeat protein
MNWEAVLQDAIAFHQAGDLQRAESSYRAVLREGPAHPLALHNLGGIAMQLGHLRMALPLLGRAWELAQHSPEVWLSLARCRYELGDWEASLALIGQAAANGFDAAQFDALRKALVGEAGGRKIFCVGRNKTGTTSTEVALRSFGLRLGLQARGEALKGDWARRDFTRIVDLCRTADAFQDVPFSGNFTFQAVDMHFPGSKFILTVRDDADQWYESLVRFHTKIVNKGRVPTADDLRNFEYRYKGYLWDSFVLTYSDDEADLYRKDLYIQNYVDHNRNVIEYFRHRPHDLLVLNVGEPDAMRRLCDFLGQAYVGQPMPHLNRSGHEPGPLEHAN